MADSPTLKIPCPNCGQKVSNSLAWLKANDQFTCMGCGRTVEVDSADHLKGLDAAD